MCRTLEAFSGLSWKESWDVFGQHLLCAKHYDKHFPYIILVNHCRNPLGLVVEKSLNYRRGNKRGDWFCQPWAFS